MAAPRQRPLLLPGLRFQAMTAWPKPWPKVFWSATRNKCLPDSNSTLFNDVVKFHRLVEVTQPAERETHRPCGLLAPGNARLLVGIDVKAPQLRGWTDRSKPFSKTWIPAPCRASRACSTKARPNTRRSLQFLPMPVRVVCSRFRPTTCASNTLDRLSDAARRNSSPESPVEPDQHYLDHRGLLEWQHSLPLKKAARGHDCPASLGGTALASLTVVSPRQFSALSQSLIIRPQYRGS